MILDLFCDNEVIVPLHRKFSLVSKIASCTRIIDHYPIVILKIEYLAKTIKNLHKLTKSYFKLV